MAKGPSPLIPLLLVVALGLLLRGSSNPINLNLPLVSEAENAIVLCFISIPILVLLVVYSASHTIVLPVALILVVYTVTTTLLGPLMVILMAYLVASWLPPVRCDREELGWGCLVVLGFVLLWWVLSDEGRHSGALVLAILIFIWYHFSS